ncbi:MAG: cation:proton antiporter [Bacteroidales bacterium]|nr:cation:proton antiporter [Bacteroidales bacterium]
MDPIWLSIAFIFGFLVRTVGLPPLVGYLIAGFVLNYVGAKAGEFVEVASELGVTLLLFTIGLKLKIRNLIKPEIWGGALTHMLSVTILYGLILWGISFMGLRLFSSFDWKLSLLIAFSFSFSSTVFAVKVLEEKGEMKSQYGQVSIGVLIIQDLIAVIFLVIAAGKTPSIYALLLPLVLFLIRPVLLYILKRIGHGELLILYGLFLALIVGAELFKAVGLKADLGALAVGIMLSNQKKGKELAENLLHFKDIFLIGFFLSIGLSGSLSMEIVLLSLLFALILNLKILLYFVVFTRFRLRARTSVHASFVLANYSEFGLIIAALAVANGWITGDWMVTIALALAISFVVASPINKHAHSIYDLIKDKLHRFETAERLIYDRTIDIKDAEILIFGMGNLGTATYDQLNKRYGQKVLGLDYNEDKVKKHQVANRNVTHDDATDSEFWEYVSAKPFDQLKLVMLCMEDHSSNMFAAERLIAINYKGIIAATALFDDEIKELQAKGVHSAYNLYTEAGIGFADQICEKLASCNIKQVAEE